MNENNYNSFLTILSKMIKKEAKGNKGIEEKKIE